MKIYYAFYGFLDAALLFFIRLFINKIYFAMIMNYIISSFRSISRHKIFSFINLFGLSIAMAAVILIFLWVNNELSFDKFHENSENIFRVEENQYYNNDKYHVNVTPWPAGPTWEREIPEIEKAARLVFTGSMLFRKDEQKFYEPGVISADSGFFRIFTFPFLYGNPETSLDSPNSIVISEEIALKYFGDNNPVGEILQINNMVDCRVTGVMKKIPNNSSLKFEAAISFDYMINHTTRYSESWGNNSILTMVQLNPHADISKVNQKLTDVVSQNNENNDVEFMVAPLEELHLYSYFGFGVQQRGIQNIYIFSAVGLFILIIACINFMNLTTARSVGRSKEIGIRKVNGAHRENLIIQFLGESMIMTIIAFMISIIIVLSLFPAFNQFTGKEFTASSLYNPVMIFSIVLLIIITSLLSGTYPALYLSSLIPVKIFSASGTKPSGKAYFRKITVIIQFCLTIILIIGTVIIYGQLNYMQSKSLGYDKENILYIPLRGDMRDSYSKLKEELNKMPVILSITATAHIPYSIGSNSGGVDWEGKDPDLQVLVSTGASDYDYVETMKIEMKSGRSFSKDYVSDGIHDTIASFMINEEMEKIMDIDNILGTKLHYMGFHGPIIGVVKNYHFKSIRNEIEPLAIIVAPTEYLNFMVMRLSPGNVQKNIKEINKTWDEIMPLYPFDYKFLDEDFDTLYKEEESMGKLMGYFALVAIIIACVGLFGLSVFNAEQKTKEIGIRKAHGASTRSILFLFSKEIVVLMVISSLLSWPLAYFLLSRWLQNFDYRIDLNPAIFLGAGLASLLIAMLSVSYQSAKAARKNPALTLRYE